MGPSGGKRVVEALAAANMDGSFTPESMLRVVLAYLTVVRPAGSTEILSSSAVIRTLVEADLAVDLTDLEVFIGPTGTNRPRLLPQFIESLGGSTVNLLFADLNNETST